MRYFFRITVLTLLFVAKLNAAFSTSELEISILTCSPGYESFTAWGHSAIRVVDKSSSTDLVYNFGLFDFNTPNFYLKFVKGKLKYKLGYHNTWQFIMGYSGENRWIKEQVLDLNEKEKQEIIKQLEHLYKPENRYYYYSFLKKNCTTELRDLLALTTGAEFSRNRSQDTYRDQINVFLSQSPWLKLGINLVFGPKVDKGTDLFEGMFLPEYFCNGLDNSKIRGNKLVKSENMLLNEWNGDLPYFFGFRPVIVFSLLLILVVLFKSRKLYMGVFFVAGLTGIAMFIVLMLTGHPELKNNINILWCNPLYLVASFMLLTGNVRYLKPLLVFISILSFLSFISGIAGIQRFIVAFYPIMASLMVINYKLIIKPGLMKFKSLKGIKA